MFYNINDQKNKKTTKHTMIISNKIDKLNTYLSIHTSSYEFFNFVNIKDFVCPICGCSDLISHGIYSRRLVNDSGDSISINIYRIKCKCCTKTHAIIPSFIIPYFKYPLEVVLEIVAQLKQGGAYKDIVYSLLIYNLDLSYIYFINKKYLLWELFYSKITNSLSATNIFNTLNYTIKHTSHKFDFRNRIMKYFLHIRLS